VEKAASRYAAGERIRECKFAVQRRETYHWNLDREKYIVLVKSLVMLIPNYIKICSGKKE
jgi:hypothetical protein